METVAGRRLGIASVAAVASLFVVAGDVEAQCQYEVTILQFPIDCGIGTVNTTGLSLNDHRVVVGRYQCPLSKYSQGFLWTAEGGFVGLQPPAGVIEVIPTDINDEGVICGTMIVADIGFRGFVYDHGAWTVLPPVVDMLGTWSSAAAISNDNIVVGQRSITDLLTPQNAYIWSAEQGFTDLTVLGDNSSATAINGTRVVGWRAHAGQEKEGFLWQEGKVILLGPVPRGFSSEAFAVSNDAVIVGSGRIPMQDAPVGATRGFMWQEGEFTMLGTLPDHTRSRAHDIRREPWQVVGRSWNVDGNPNIAHGFIWQNGVMTDLNSLIPSESGPVILSAGAINTAGQIITAGRVNGNVVAALLTPIEGPIGDLDTDCAVGFTDLWILLSNWGPCPPKGGCPTDLNGDGVVGILDLLTLLANWT